MPRRLTLAVLLALAIAAAGVQGQAPTDREPASQDRPLDSTLVERTERSLVQLDVSLTPKKKRADAAMPELNIDDLELVINAKRIEIRYADRLCQLQETQAETETAAVPPAPVAPRPVAAAAPTARGAFLFYFEHKNLTMEGQQNGLVMAEELIPQLVGNGTRGMVVSSGRKLLQSELTDDPERLLEFLRRIRGDVEQWGEMAYAEGEWERYADIFGQQDPDQGEPVGYAIERAKRRALTYAREEQTITNKQLRRFAAVLGSFAELDPPKAALYFADTIRKNAGKHYEMMFGEHTREQGIGTTLDRISSGAFVAGLAFDRVTEQATAHGIRLYTIRARGLELSMSTVIRSGAQRPNQLPVPDRGARDAEETMVSFATETGGASFRGGTESSAVKRVVNRIRSDLSCFYLLSFYPDGLPEDSALPVRVRFNVDSPRYDELNEAWELKTRGQLVVQSAARRKESMLLAAHAASSAVDSETGRSVLIPLGFAGDRYHALVQFVVDNPELPAGLSTATAWDLGMSHVFKEKVADRVSRRVEVDSAGLPVVLEAAWTFPPGSGEIVSVGYENRFGRLASVALQTDWPNPSASPALITPIAVVQPADGVFLRVDSSGEEQPRGEGPLALGDTPARLDRPIYLIGLVCRRQRDRDLWIDRKLVGNVSVDFGLQHWEAGGDERCVQTRDLIRPGQAGWGDYRYAVRVYDDQALEGEPLAERVREFTALEQAPVAAASYLE